MPTERSIVEGADAARADLGPARTKPAWLQSRLALPFPDLSDDEFEVFSYLLLLREHPGERIVYYGKTRDAGRDIVRFLGDGKVEIIQCKRFTTNVGSDKILAELTKLCVNVFDKVIPAPPDRVSFYAVPNLTGPAKDLIGDRSRWHSECEDALEKHLKRRPPHELVTFARDWWPTFEHQDEHRLTLRANEHQPLINEFFQLRPYVTGDLADLEPQFAGINQEVVALRMRLEEVAGGPTPVQSVEGASAPERHTAGSQILQVRLLAAKVSAFEERDRQHMDEAGKRLIDEVQGAVRELDLARAVVAIPRLEAWLADAGQRASASVRGRTAVLLADLALIEQAESRGGGAVDTGSARRWYARAADDFSADAPSEDLARLVALETKLLTLEGRGAEALDVAAACPDDPACLTTRLSTLLEDGRYEEAIRAVDGLPLHERWCDRVVIAHAALGDAAEAEQMTAVVKRKFDQLTYRRCLHAQAQGTLWWVLSTWPEAQSGHPGTPPADVESALQNVLAALRPILAVAEVNERASTGLEAEAIACAVVAALLLGDRERCARLLDLLGTREPVHLEYARAAFRGDIEPPEDLPVRLRRDHPNHFEARFLAAILAGESADEGGAAFSDAQEVVRLARTEEEKERAVGLLLELAAQAPEGAFQTAERAATEALGEDHRFARFARAARLLAAKQADEAAPIVESLRTDDDPLWRQFAATVALLRGNEEETLEHYRAASRVLVRPEVLVRTALLAHKLGRDEAAEEVLVRLVALRPKDPRGWKMLVNTSVRLGRHGQTARAFEALRELEPDVVSHGVNYAKSLALSGRRQEAVRAFDAVCERHPHALDAVCGRAHLLDILGRPDEAFHSLHRVREVFWSEPTFLLLYLQLGHRARHEEEAALALGRLLELQREGRDVPLWTLTLDEFLDEFRQRRQAHEERNREILRGRMPWLAVGRTVGRPAMGDWAYRTQELVAPPDDPQQRAEFTIYSTNGWTVQPDGEGGRALRRITACPPAGTPVVADLTSLVTLHHLGLLDRAAGYFGGIIIPASYAELALHEQTDYLPNQPSRLDAASEILDALDRGRITALPAGRSDDPHPLLEEHGDGPSYRLRDIVSWLYTAGHIDERRAAEVTSSLRDQGQGDGFPPVAEAARGGFRTTVLTLEAAITAGLFPTLIATTRLYLPAEVVDEVRERLWAAEHQERLARQHQALWDTVREDSRFEQAEVTLPEQARDDERDRRFAAVFDAPLLASARTAPLLVDDRAFQAVVLNGRPADPYPAFGTDCLLEALAEAGVISEDELADAFLELVRRRYRFLVPPVRVLVTLAARHRAHPPGGPLREVSRYVHDCFRDPGLLAGLEPVEPPTSVAFESFRHWHHHVARFVVELWRDDRFDENSARALTVWAMGELLPSPPRSLHRMGVVVLTHAAVHHVLGTVFEEVWRFESRDRAARVIREVTRVLRLTRAQYLDVTADYLDTLSTLAAGTDNPELERAFRGRLAETVLAGVETIGPRVYFSLDRLGVLNEPPRLPPDDELAAITDPAHPRRLPGPPGPIVFLRVVGDERRGEAVSVSDYLLHPARAARDAAVRYLEQAPEGPASWLCTRSRAAVAEYAAAVRSELAAEWIPAGRRLSELLEEDFLSNLAGFRQCWGADLRQGHEEYWRRVIRPDIHLFASIPAEWYDVPPPDGSVGIAGICVDGAASLAEALDRYFARYGHLPLAPPATAGAVLRRWVEMHGTRGAAWGEVQNWVEARPSPIRSYHACQAFLECPDLIPDGQATALWEHFGWLGPPAQEPDERAEPPPDLGEVGWELRTTLARHYLGQLELHTVGLPGNRLAALAWWTAERVASELTTSFAAAGVEIAPALRTALDRAVAPEAELTDAEWGILRPAGQTSVFAFGTMQARSLWVTALFATPTPGVPLASPYEPYVGMALLHTCLSGFPPPGAPIGSGLVVFNQPFDAAAAAWAAMIGNEENRRFLQDALAIRAELADRDGLLRAVRGLPDAEQVRQAVVSHAFRVTAALGGIDEAAVWELLADTEWVSTCVTRLEPGPLQALCEGLIEVQRQTGDRWNWALPHLLGSLAEDLDVPPERRRLLALATVRSAAVGGGQSPVRRLLNGKHREVLGPALDEWREQFVLVRSMAPPLAAAFLRDITANLSR